MARKKSENPIAPFKPRKFACSKWPFLGIGGGMKFDRGFLTVESSDQMERLERTDAYKCGQIVEIKERKGVEPKMSIEETAELAALDELKKLEPRANRGAVSTQTMRG